MSTPPTSAPATSFAGSAQRIWQLTRRSDDPWRTWRLTMGAMALTPLAWLLVLARYVVAAPVLLPRRIARIRRARRHASP